MATKLEKKPDLLSFSISKCNKYYFQAKVDKTDIVVVEKGK